MDHRFELETRPTPSTRKAFVLRIAALAAARMLRTLRRSTRIGSRRLSRCLMRRQQIRKLRRQLLRAQRASPLRFRFTNANYL